MFRHKYCVNVNLWSLTNAIKFTIPNAFFKVKFGKEWVETNIPQAASVRNKKWQAKWETNAAR